MVTGKFGEGCIEERVCSSLLIRGDEVVRRLEWAEKREVQE